MTEADDSSIAYAYDAAGRETQQVWYDSLSTAYETLLSVYDDSGLLVSASNSNGTYTFDYDDNGRLTHVAEPFGVSLNYAYDDDGRQTQVVDSFGGTQVSVYDLENRLTRRTYQGQGQELRVDYTYDALRRIDTESRYSDLAGTSLVAVSDYDYDANGRITHILHSDSTSATIDEFTYDYDPAGYLETAADNSGTITYTNDNAGQLTGDGTNTYTYDDAGNRVGGSYGVTLGNQMTADASWTYSYDQKGNLTEKDSVSTSEHWTYGYDDRNQLTQVKHYDATNALVMTDDNKYDYFGSRIQKTVNDGVTTEVSRYALDGWNPARPSNIGTEGFNVWAKLDGSSSLETRYFYNDEIDHLIARIDHVDTTAVQLWYLQDYQNSTRYVLDQTGAIVDSLHYDGYGNIDTGSELDPSMRGDYAWTGRELDVETGLQYNRARWYDGTTGRWISEDPLGFDAGDSNLYRYVNNKPAPATDPSGLAWTPWVPTGVHEPARYTDYRFSRVGATQQHRAFQRRNPDGRWFVRTFHAPPHKKAPFYKWELDPIQPFVSGVLPWSDENDMGPHQEMFEFKREWVPDPPPFPFALPIRAPALNLERVPLPAQPERWHPPLAPPERDILIIGTGAAATAVGIKAASDSGFILKLGAYLRVGGPLRILGAPLFMMDGQGGVYLDEFDDPTSRFRPRAH